MFNSTSIAIYTLVSHIEIKSNHKNPGILTSSGLVQLGYKVALNLKAFIVDTLNYKFHKLFL